MCTQYPKAKEFINKLSKIANFTLNGTHGAFMLFNAWKGMKMNDEKCMDVKFRPDNDEGIEIEFSDTTDLEHYQRTVNETIQNIYKRRHLEPCEPGANEECCPFFVKDDCDYCCIGGTNIIKALNTSLNMMFQSSSGMRKDAEQVAVLITDGQDTGEPCDTDEDCDKFRQDLEKKYDELAKIFKVKKIKILAIGVGKIDKDNLLRLVQSPEHFFPVESFDGLTEKVTQLIGAIICKGISVLRIIKKLFTSNEL